MSDQSDDNRKPAGIGKKEKKAWYSLKNIVAILSSIVAILGLIILLFSHIDELKNIFFKSISNNTKEQISQISTLPPNEREVVLTECLEFDTQCLLYILKACEKMTLEDEAMQESIEWINQLDLQLANDDVFDECLEAADNFLKKSNQINSNDVAENGFNFYIELLKNFETNYPNKVKSTYVKFIKYIEEQPSLYKVTKTSLIHKID